MAPRPRNVKSWSKNEWSSLNGLTGSSNNLNFDVGFLGCEALDAFFEETLCSVNSRLLTNIECDTCLGHFNWCSTKGTYVVIKPNYHIRQRPRIKYFKSFPFVIITLLSNVRFVHLGPSEHTTMGCPDLVQGGLYGYILRAHVNECTLLNNVMMLR